MSAHKLEELKQKFYMEAGETDATEAQVEDGSTLQQEGTLQVGFPHCKYDFVPID
jgi:hypothetical protein